MNGKSRGISLQGLIALAIVCGTLLLGGTLTWRSYTGMQHVVISAAGDYAQQLGITVNERARRLIEPAQNVIRLLAHDPVADAPELSQRLTRLPLLVQALQANTMLSAIYVGYDNGEFLLVRPLHGSNASQHFGGPPESAFLVQSISLGQSGKLIGEWRFYDTRLTLLDTQAKPDYHFDPRTRSWFTHTTTTVLTRPYTFFTTEEAGLTLAQRATGQRAVIGMDVSIADLSAHMQDLRMTPGTELAVVDREGQVIAHQRSAQTLVKETRDLRLSRISEIGIASLAQLFDSKPGEKPTRYRVNDAIWYGMNVPLTTLAHQELDLLIAVPATEMLAGAREALVDEIIWIAVLIPLMLLVGLILGRRIGRPLNQLADQVHSLSGFDFSREVGVRSHVTEVRELSMTLSRMSRTIHNFQAIALTLNRESRLDVMLIEVLARLVELAGVRSGAVYLLHDNDDALRLAARSDHTRYPDTLALAADAEGSPTATVIGALASEAHYLALPLNNRNQQSLGVLVLELTAEHEQSESVRQAFKHFMEELSGAVSVAIETRQLIEAQKRLLDAIIKLLADAIDAKSPYTGGHCERVPQLAQMLLDQAIAAKTGPYADFHMSAAELYEFHIAAWLHDCGKITSPDFVVDKATKLETLYNRIHEIRTRFEVLWRDAEIDYWKQVAGGDDPAVLRHMLEARHTELQEAFAFVANANIGGEFMKDTDISRLAEIGAWRWMRHFDNGIGVSRSEADLLATLPPASLPVEEQLLADRAEHVVPWGDRKPAVDKHDPRNVWGFDMRLPANAYNHGELYNLSIRRGTLNDEERFKINEHIVQTIIMLESLPFPRDLKRVPAIAGNHHEKMDGTGYPRRLNQENMSTAERVMAIADIFEALTAADRPYKPAKSLSESLAILAAMARDKHIDAQLFCLFLTSGVYLEYARHFLQPAQLDNVDIDHYLAVAGELEPMQSGTTV